MSRITISRPKHSIVMWQTWRGHWFWRVTSTNESGTELTRAAAERAAGAALRDALAGGLTDTVRQMLGGDR